MTPLRVVFLWHMHQPYYVDPLTRCARMPWVRLHACKGYLDMISLIDAYPKIRCVFNLTPVLARQIEQLSTGEITDEWLEWSKIPAADLTLDQKCNLLTHFFSVNWDNLIKPHPRYRALLQKRGPAVPHAHLQRLAASFTAQEYRDLQVWFNLVWFGHAALKQWPELTELRKKDRDFTEDDKKIVLDRQLDIVKTVLSRYKNAQDRGQIELSTSPFYHPIMPLVYNTDFASRCMHGRKFPPTFSHPEDVKAQLSLAKEQHERIFGRPPHGIWPSEGSVAPEIVPILHELGYQWFATDEEILTRTLAQLHAPHDRHEIYHGWRVQTDGAHVFAAFRDRPLSDFIGFTASRNPPEKARDFMVQYLHHVASRTERRDKLCAIILDGENAWEFFPDGAEQFFHQLYGALSNDSRIATTTFHDYFNEFQASDTLPTLHTGSWIHADFDIWIGEPEENKAWEWLGRTRQFLQTRLDRNELNDEQRAPALDEIYAAEGSDWFWWYGPDFSTDCDLLFDELFRLHLQNVYKICGGAPPEFLKHPIARSEIRHETQQPANFITPILDGQRTSYYEWAGAGHYDAGKFHSTMYRSGLVEKVYFGFNRDKFFLRLDFRPRAEIPAALGVILHILQPRNVTVSMTPLRPNEPIRAMVATSEDGVEFTPAGEINNAGLWRDIVELAIPFSELRCNPRERVGFFVQILDNSIELERHPEAGTIQFVTPDESFEVENWSV
jgi:alpha-amylase/alpha-mannosidase (GH57 family)